MSKFRRKYILNPDTLLYETSRTPRRSRIIRTLAIFAASIGLTVFYGWLYVSVFERELPKTVILRKQNERWISEMEIMNRQLDKYEEALEELQMRNDDVYRSIFGMNPIPKEVLDAGFGGVNRYAFLENAGMDNELKKTYMRVDVLARQSYVQSKSFDEVAELSKRAGDMAVCRPAIPPINPVKGTYRVSSSFGGRVDPVYGGYRYHEGVDFSTRRGSPIYATGDGVIESIKFQLFGYGRQVVINHGFGYRTRYAHMNDITVVEGMKIKRGECIGTVGNSGKSTGDHLHYEVEYRGHKVNPANFYDLDVSSDEYMKLIVKKDSESEAILRPQFQLRTR